MRKKLTPAMYVIQVLGGIRPTAKIAARDPAAVYRWGKRGVVPIAARPAILKYAKKNKLPITPIELEEGGRL